MGRSRVVVAVVAAALVCGGATSAVFAATRTAGPTTKELTITVSDGTRLACGLVLPGGSAPAGGWPGLLLFHGLGQTHAFMEKIAAVAVAPAAFASLACDARGTGASGGKFGLDGPREVQDARDLFGWLAGRSDVSDTRIGAFGLSLGGAEVWNAAVAGVPFKAIVPAVTWTNLATALNPNGVPKSGLIDELSRDVPLARWDASLAGAWSDLSSGKVTAAVKTAESARSSRSKLHSLRIPTLLLQGRHDFLFDADQAVAAYRLLAGPKRLYLGDLGHAPATNPQTEEIVYLGEAVGWLEHYLAGAPKLVRGGVELAHDPWNGRTSFYEGIPRRRHKAVNLPGKTTLGSPGASVRRSVRLTGGPLETFGGGSVTVRYSGAQQWGDLIAAVAVKGTSTPVTFGAAAVKARAGVLRIPLSNQAVFLPRGKRLVVTVGGQTAGGVYEPAPPPTVGGNSITVRRITLDLSLLKRAVSR
ncbi:MAG TPA: CocE/NonD family hydrolase [Gaiellaceae bacterium]|nr:CocE/NonD family hydrolase [Gaiellaceae bacterium]